MNSKKANEATVILQCELAKKTSDYGNETELARGKVGLPILRGAPLKISKI